MSGSSIDCDKSDHSLSHTQSFAKCKVLSSQVNGCLCYTPSIFFWTTNSHSFMLQRERCCELHFFLSFWKWQPSTLLHCPLHSPTHFRSHAHVQVTSLFPIFLWNVQRLLWDYFRSKVRVMKLSWAMYVCSPIEFDNICVKLEKKVYFSSLQHAWGLNLKGSSKVLHLKFHNYIGIIFVRLRALNHFQLNMVCLCYETLGIPGGQIRLTKGGGIVFFFYVFALFFAWQHKIPGMMLHFSLYHHNHYSKSL